MICFTAAAFAPGILLIAGLLTFMSLPPATMADGASTPEDNLYNLGLTQYNERNFTGAVRTFSGFIAHHPKSKLVPDALFYMADSDYNLGHFSSAAKGFDTLLARYPDHPRCEEALFTKAWTLFEMRKEKKGLAALTQLAGRYPNGKFAPKALYSIGDYHYNKQHYEEAYTAYSSLLIRYPGSEAAKKVPAVLKELEATVSYLEYERIFPQFARAQKTNDRALLRSSAESFERVMMEYPDTESATGAYANAFVCRKKLGDWRSALSFADSLISRRNRPAPPVFLRYRQEIENKLKGKTGGPNPPDKFKHRDVPPHYNGFRYALFPFAASAAWAAEKTPLSAMSRNHGNTVYLMRTEHAIDGSEDIRANGVKLVRGADYRIDFRAGTVTFIDEKLMTPDAIIDISYRMATSRRNIPAKKGIIAPSMEMMILMSPLGWNPEAGKFDIRRGVLRGLAETVSAQERQNTVRITVESDGSYTVDGASVPKKDLERVLREKVTHRGYGVYVTKESDAPDYASRFLDRVLRRTEPEFGIYDNNVSPLGVTIVNDSCFKVMKKTVSRNDLAAAIREQLPRHCNNLVIDAVPAITLETLRFVIESSRLAEARDIRWKPVIDGRMQEIVKSDGR